MISEQQLKEAEEFIARDPARAAYQLADVTQRYNELFATVGAIRCFAQNTDLALQGDKSAIEFALGGRKL